MPLKKATAQEIFDYTQAIINISNCEKMKQQDKDFIIEKIKKLIADELNKSDL